MSPRTIEMDMAILEKEYPGRFVKAGSAAYYLDRGLGIAFFGGPFVLIILSAVAEFVFCILRCPVHLGF